MRGFLKSGSALDSILLSLLDLELFPAFAKKLNVAVRAYFNRNAFPACGAGCSRSRALLSRLRCFGHGCVREEFASSIYHYSTIQRSQVGDHASITSKDRTLRQQRVKGFLGFFPTPRFEHVLSAHAQPVKAVGASDDYQKATRTAEREIKGDVIEIGQNLRDLQRRAREIEESPKLLQNGGVIPLPPPARSLREDELRSVSHENVAVPRECDTSPTMGIGGVRQTGYPPRSPLASGAFALRGLEGDGSSYTPITIKDKCRGEAIGDSLESLVIERRCEGGPATLPRGQNQTVGEPLIFVGILTE